MRAHRNILIILGNPARERESFCAALAGTYRAAATGAGHEAEILNIARLVFDPILHEGYHGEQAAEPDITAAREKIARADHIVFVYPMWQFAAPALLKGFLERVFTPGFAYDMRAKTPLRGGLLRGKSARIIQTMGMPSLFYRLFFGARAARTLRDMLKFCGLAPVRVSFFGTVESERHRKRHLEEARRLGTGGE